MHAWQIIDVSSFVARTQVTALAGFAVGWPVSGPDSAVQCSLQLHCLLLLHGTLGLFSSLSSTSMYCGLASVMSWLVSNVWHWLLSCPCASFRFPSSLQPAYCRQADAVRDADACNSSRAQHHPALSQGLAGSVVPPADSVTNA